MADTTLIDTKATFASFSQLVDPRLLKALADMGYARPTLVQARGIPLALEGRDVLARARTGSGKTAAYCVPLVQKILTRKKDLTPEDLTWRSVGGLILVPTRELSEQVTKHLKQLLAYCEKDVFITNLASGTPAHLQRVTVSEQPDVVVATPARALASIQNKSISLTQLETLVIDEADLVLSYGHDEDLRAIMDGGFLPKVYQSFLMSATMTKDVEKLKGLVLRNPVILRLEEDEDDAAKLTQYVVKCNEVDKFLLTYVILKMKLVKGKCIIFVNDVDRCYRLKLFLEQFSIKSCVLNSELPLNSRVHIVQEFNKGVYDYIIATDEASGAIEDEADSETENEDAEVNDNGGAEEDKLVSTQRDADASETENIEEVGDPGPSSEPSVSKRKRSLSPPAPKSTKKSKKTRAQPSDKEYGVVRGVDFINVACVLNFDLPVSVRAYTHRVGRTARAGRTGMALSFVVPPEEWGKNKVVGSLRSAKRDTVRFARIEKEQGARGSKIKEYNFDMKQVEAFRYRMQDALRSVTRSAIREARLKELKAEILNSEKLKAHFEDNPLDLEYLRHDKPLHPTRIQPHMKHVPKYLMPKLGGAVGPVGEGGEPSGVDTGKEHQSFVPFKKMSTRGRGRGRGRGGKMGGPGHARKKADPLKKFGR